MKRKRILIAAFVAALVALEPTMGHAQSASSGEFFNENPTNITGSSSWGFFNNVGSDNNANVNSNSGFWGAFTNTGSDSVSLGSGLALLTAAGFGYACAKRRKEKKQELHSKR